jgi:hypothetical protein
VAIINHIGNIYNRVHHKYSVNTKYNLLGCINFRRDIMKYYICSGEFSLYKVKIKNIQKMIAVAYNYNADLYYTDDNGEHTQYIYINEFNNKLDNDMNNKFLKEYNVEMRLNNNYSEEMYSPYYIREKDTIDLFKKYGDVELESIAKEVQ